MKQKDVNDHNKMECSYEEILCVLDIHIEPSTTDEMTIEQVNSSYAWKNEILTHSKVTIKGITKDGRNFSLTFFNPKKINLDIDEK